MVYQESKGRNWPVELSAAARGASALRALTDAKRAKAVRSKGKRHCEDWKSMAGLPILEYVRGWEYPEQTPAVVRRVPQNRPRETRPKPASNLARKLRSERHVSEF